MRTTGKNGHRAPRVLEGLAMIFDLGGFLHPQPRALGDFSEDAAAAGSDWASVGENISCAWTGPPRRPGQSSTPTDVDSTLALVQATPGPGAQPRP